MRTDQTHRYLIATHSYLVEVDLSPEGDKAVDGRVIAEGYHYGIGLVPASSNYLVYRGGEAGVGNQDDPRIVHRSLGHPRHHTVPVGVDLRDVHQVACSDTGFYLANTGMNTLVFQSYDGTTMDECVLGTRGQDTVHLNSVYMAGPGCLLVVLHNRARGTSQIMLVNHAPGRGFYIVRKHRLWDVGCHNVCIDDGILLYNGSARKRLVMVDLDSDAIRDTVAFDGWHTKGLSVTDRFLVVGLSEHTVRDRRSSSQSRLGVFCRETKGLISELPLGLPRLPPALGNINEIRCISHPELGQGSADFPRAFSSGNRLAERKFVAHHFKDGFRMALLPLRRAKARLIQTWS